MAERNDPAKHWLEKLRQHRWVAVIVVATTILGGISAALGNLTDIYKIFENQPLPRVEAFTLSPSAQGFEETQNVLFGASEQLYRTFAPIYPFQPEPTSLFLVTISNPQSRDLTLTQVIYDVHEVGEVKGGTPGPLVALAKYQHKISHEVGEQKWSMIPPFSIPAGQAASFEIQITSASKESGLGWYLRIGFVSSGGIIYTDDFQLMMPKWDGEPQMVAVETDKPDEERGGILTRVGDSGPLPSPDFRDCIFREAGIEGLVGLDALDRDFIYMRAGNMRYEDFILAMTETSPPVGYASLMSDESVRKLLTLVKTHVRPDVC
jgi:hypothetical protein